MNTKSTTHQWENAETLKTEKLKAENQNGSVPQFANEQQFLDGLKSFMRVGRESRAPGVARVARFWERKITFSVLVAQQRLQRSKAVKAKAEKLKTETLKLQVGVLPGSTTASPSSLRIRAGVSPSPD